MTGASISDSAGVAATAASVGGDAILQDRGGDLADFGIMRAVSKKIVLGELGEPVEVILSWENFCEIAEAFGWDLDEQTKENLRQTRADIEVGRDADYTPLSKL